MTTNNTTQTSKQEQANKQEPSNGEPPLGGQGKPRTASCSSKPARSKDKKKPPKKQTFLKWIFTVLFLTLVLSFSFSLASEFVLVSAPLWIAYSAIVLLIFVGVVFDVIATSAAACELQPFLAMAARKVKGAKRAMYLAKNADRVSSICGDIIGDICGIVSGSFGAAIVAAQFMSASAETKTILLSVLFSAVIAALTVTGKAIGKQFALSNSNRVIFTVARLLSIFDKKAK